MPWPIPLFQVLKDPVAATFGNTAFRWPFPDKPIFYNKIWLELIGIAWTAAETGELPHEQWEDRHDALYKLITEQLHA